MATVQPDYTAPTFTGALAAAASAPAGSSGPTAYDPAKLQASAGPMTEAASWTPDDSSLVANNLTKLLSGDNAYMQQARTRAMQYANSRGLLNSSLAATAGESAAIDAALPIAQADAGTYARSQSENTAAKNNFGLDANRFGREGALAAMNNEFTAGESAANRKQNADQFGQDINFRRESFGSELALKDKSLTADTAIRQGQLDVQREGQRSEANTREAQLQQEMQRSYMDARLQLETTPNLDAAAKANAINAMSDWFYQSALPAVRSSYSNPAAWPAPAAPKASVAVPTPTTPATAPEGSGGYDPTRDR